MKSLIQLGSLFIILLLAGCETEDDSVYVEDLDTVITQFDESKDFDKYLTFAIPDSIPYLDGKDEVSFLNDDNIEVARLIIETFKRNMTDLGYVEVDENIAEPDVLMNIGVLTSRYVGIYGGPCGWYGDPYYWGWYPGWGWGSGFGWGYYPCWGSGFYAYEYGSLVFDMVDVENTVVEDETNNTLDVAWTGTVRGLLQGTEQQLNNRISMAIDQAFVQSPYLSTK